VPAMGFGQFDLTRASYIERWIDISMHDIVEISAENHNRSNPQLYVPSAVGELLHVSQFVVETCTTLRQVARAESGFASLWGVM
jgi:hypothetical protein